MLSKLSIFHRVTGTVVIDRPGRVARRPYPIVTGG